MQLLNIQQVHQVAGGAESYNVYFNTEIPLSFLPIIANQYGLTEFGNDLSQIVQNATAQGLDPNQVKIGVSFGFSVYSDPVVGC